MAIADFIPEIWSARFLTKLEATRVWGLQTNKNYEGELSSNGNTVNIPQTATSISVGDYVAGTAITAAPDQADGSTIPLLVDQQKFFRFIVDDIHEYQSAPSLMDDAMREAALQVAITQDNYLKGIYAAGHNDSRSVTVTEDLSAAGTPTKLIEAFITTKAAMSNADVPTDGRWAVVNPRFIAQLEKHFLTNPADGVFTPTTADSTLTNGFSGNLLGYNLYVTSNSAVATLSNVVNDRIVLGQSNENVTMAEQIREVEATRPAEYFADMVKGLYVYGAKLVHPDRIWTITHKQA